MSLTLSTTIMRDGLAHDVTIHFEAECVSPGYRATYMQPGEGPEYEITFGRAELVCPEPDDHDLTEAEIDTVRTWFVANFDKASDEAANDNFAAGPDPDAARDRAFDDERFWRGLEA